jgi:predicted dehydrogenase
VTPPRIGLIGANGHGRWHRRRIAAMQAEGEAVLAGLADPAPVDADLPVPAGAGVFTDHRDLLRAAAPDVVVVCTPPHTHLRIALDAVAAGCDLLLEKPPVLSLADHEVLAAALRDTGRACQVGFQALGSAALGELTRAVAGGALGRITGVAALACWQRDDAYYRRAPWAGRRGRDGALVNPLAHAIMQCLAVAEAAGAGPPTRLEVERYRTRPIEVDDTAVLRLTLGEPRRPTPPPRDSASVRSSPGPRHLSPALRASASLRSSLGPTIVVAVTLAGEEFVPGEIRVTGTATGGAGAGKSGDSDGAGAVLEYPTDRLRLPGDRRMRHVDGRTDLLANLLAHRADPAGTPLVAPLARTASFTAVAQALAAAPEPVTLNGDTAGVTVDDVGVPPARVRVVRGINGVLTRAADRLALPSEMGVPWASPAWTESLVQTEVTDAR